METGAPEETAVVPIARPASASVTPLVTEALAAAKAHARDALAPETLRLCHRLGPLHRLVPGRRLRPAAGRARGGAAYLAAQAPLYGRSALERRLAAIGHAHRLRGLDWSAGHPAIRTTLRGIFRAHGSRRRQAAALTSAELKKLVAACGGDLAGLCDRALRRLQHQGHMASACDKQVRDHTRHRDLKTMRGYILCAKLVMESATRLLDL
jgi:hypothetical protein